jgi:outer membrane protein
MSFRRTALASLLALVLAAAAAQAGDLVTREQARSLATANSPTLQRLLLSVDSAKLAEQADRYGLLPAVSASAGADLSWPRSSLAAAAGGSVSLSLRQAIYDGRIPVQLAIDALDTEMAREEARAGYFSTRESADTAFAGVVDAQASLDAAASDLEATRTREALAAAKLEAGMIIRADLLKAQSESAAAETSVAQARGKLSTAYAKLASLTGLRLPFSVDTADPAGTTELTAKLATLTDEQTAGLLSRVQDAVAANNPALGKAGLAGKKAAKNRDMARADGLPTVGATVSNQVGFSSTGTSAGGSLALSVSIPLDLWKAANSLAAGETALRQAGLDLQEAERSTSLEVQSAVYDLVSAARTVLSSRKALEYAQSSYEAVLEKYRLSTVSSADLSDAASLVSMARTQTITARSLLLASLASIRTLTASESDGLIADLLP